MGLIGVTGLRGRKYFLSTMTLFLTVYPSKWIFVLEILAFSSPYTVMATVEPEALSTLYFHTTQFHPRSSRQEPTLQVTVKGSLLNPLDGNSMMK